MWTEFWHNVGFRHTPVMFVSQLFDSEKRKVYMYAAAAHTVHLFGTILPLVFAIYSAAIYHGSATSSLRS